MQYNPTETSRNVIGGALLALVVVAPWVAPVLAARIDGEQGEGLEEA
jgi:hypothetical protein